MSNEEIGSHFYELARLMDLHQENTYKIRSYVNAGGTLKRWDQPLAEMNEEEIQAIPGVGKAISAKISELLSTGRMQTLEKYREITPAGVREMLTISGYGPGKIRQIWEELGVESMGELLYAINENRIMRLKGFGEKTQEDLKEKLLYRLKQQENFLYAAVEDTAHELFGNLREVSPGRIEFCGAFRRQCPTLNQVDLLVEGELPSATQLKDAGLLPDADMELFRFKGWPFALHASNDEPFGKRWLELTGDRSFVEKIGPLPGKSGEEEIFDTLKLPFIPPAMREGTAALNLDWDRLSNIVQVEDICGIVHCHSTYSDGIQSLAALAKHVRDEGFQYLGITEHSKSAVYADGMEVDQVNAQWKEIDYLNEKMAPFRIFKGIESDILADGSLDYPDDILEGFEFIIASVHTHISKDEDKATARIVKAIENPYTTILGHPTGRLLLSRPPYPIDMMKILDACAANGVAVELNANPYRLDLDWTYLDDALERGIVISINPDAHNLRGIADIRYGVLVAQKAGLPVSACLTARTVSEFEEYIDK